MTQYFFELGTHQHLSREEIRSVFPQFFGTSFPKSNIFRGEFKPDLSTPSYFSEVCQNLGGTIRAGKVLGLLPDVPSVISFLFEEIQKRYETSHKKVCFGITLKEGEGRLDERLLKTLLLGTKKLCQQAKIPVRFVNRNFAPLDAGTCHKEGLLSEPNIEFLLWKEPHHMISVAQTLMAQDVDAFAKRDYGKPVRDMQVGMLPPKLALMMINLSRDTAGSLPEALWDPFCGTGTVLIEAKRLGIEIFGSDVSLAMVSASQRNLLHFFPDALSENIIAHDVTTPLEGEMRKCVIVSEGYLGEICTRPLSQEQYEKISVPVASLYAEFFGQMRNMPEVQKIVISAPFWRAKEGKFWYLSNIAEVASSQGYILQSFQEWNARGGLQFLRENQVVGREIFRFLRQE